ncbi:MAG: cellulase family glycosylhydrolase [Abditibacteriota bacterium]|nr:cellulase family glycosylhydrolase [Abditibacteriota bacterium]
MTRIFVILLLTAAAAGLWAQGWQKVAADYEKNMEYLREKTPPARYSVTDYKGKVTVREARPPELGIGIHVIDEKAIEDMKALGIRSVRTTLWWNTVEKEKGVLDEEALAGFDRAFGLLTDAGISPLVVVHENPDFVSFADRGQAYRDYAEFMTMCATRWPKVLRWELWNEMDVAFTDVFGAKDPRIPVEARGRYYAEMLKVTYPAIKKANPRATVVLGGVAGDVTPFMEGVYKAGGKGYFDVMNIHTYGMPLAWSFVNRGLDAQKVMERYGDGEKPIWNTEFGTEAGSYIAAWGKPDSLEEFDRIQAEYLTELARLNRDCGLYEICFIFQYRAESEGGKEEIEELGGDPADYTYGIMRGNGDPRPAFEALKQQNINGWGR